MRDDGGWGQGGGGSDAQELGAVLRRASRSVGVKCAVVRAREADDAFDGRIYEHAEVCVAHIFDIYILMDALFYRHT